MSVLLGLIFIGGWILGILAYADTRALRAELARLRAELAPRDIRPQPAPRAEPVPDTAPDPVSAPPPRPLEPAWAHPVWERPAEANLSPPWSPNLDDLLAMRWGIWLGAAALAFAGIFLIRYAVEHSVIGPAGRCVLAAFGGLGLLAGAEFARRRLPPDTSAGMMTAPAALSAGGVATLFAAAYGAGPFYGLLGPTAGFAMLAAASLAGMAASLRFGALTAALGVAGSFLTPALVATDSPSLPGLFTYVLVVSAAALFLQRRTAWTWLGWATTGAGALWVCAAGNGPAAGLWAAAIFVPAATLLHMILLPEAALETAQGRALSWAPLAALGAAGLVLEGLAPGAAPRLAVLALSPLAVWRGATRDRLDRLPWLGAGLGLLSLLLWAVPDFNASPAYAGTAGLIEALLPGRWDPQAIRPLLVDAFLLASFNAACGLYFERRAANPLRWGALAAAVPVTALAITYAQVTRFQADIAWAGAAVTLAASLTVTAARAARRHSVALAGVHAAGACAALALGCAMLLHDHWLTLAIALFLPALAWIEARAELPPLRQVALAVAALVLVRLCLNFYVADYLFGAAPVLNGLIPAYAVPAASMLGAAWMFGRRGQDSATATLQAGGIVLAAFFVALEIRHGYGRGQLTGDLGFNELASQLFALAAQAMGLRWVARRAPTPVFDAASRIAGGLALGLGVCLILFNPLLTNARASNLALVQAYLLPAALALAARRGMSHGDVRNVLKFYAAACGFFWLTLEIRAGFHPYRLGLGAAPVADGELWAWSGAWLVYGAGLMLAGIWRGDRHIRLLALGLIAVVCGKVFLVDMSNLTGLWRVMSFFGLGLGLIALSELNRRVAVTRE